MSQMVTLKPNPDYPADRWWIDARKAAGRRPDGARVCCPESVEEALFSPGGPREVTVSAEDAGIFEAWAARFPGWIDGSMPQQPAVLREEPALLEPSIYEDFADSDEKATAMDVDPRNLPATQRPEL